MKVIPYNETYVRIITDDFGIDQELSEWFSFMVDGYKFQPKYKAGIWDGRIRLFNTKKKTIYKGLIEEIIKFAKSRNHPLEIDESLRNTNGVSYDEVKAYVDSLDLHGRGNKLEVREYQYEAIHHAINNSRSLLLSPTASGKSLIIYSLIRWHIFHERNIVIVVPSTMLVEQLFSDFCDYASNDEFDVEENVSLLYSGKERIFNKPVVITTWQSIVAMDKNDPQKFKDIVMRSDCAVFDEAHSYKANVVLATLEKFTETRYRTGTTGTVDNAKVNKLSLVGLMGPIYKVITTKELMDAGQVVKLDIKCIVLDYPEHVKKAYKGMIYQEEVKFLVGYEKRNEFIANLASKVNGNTLILFNFVQKHGSILEKLIRDRTDRPVYFIHGGVENEEREQIRQLLSTQNNAIIVATSSLMSTGVNIPSIENIIFAIPSKSMIRILQSIGRGLRLNKGKTQCTLWDISDDMKYKSYTNTTLKHLEERVQIYDKEKFDYSIKRLKI